MNDGKLYIVATPIGNLSDFTQRAVDTLRAVDVVACEDTRHSGKLLKHHGISARMIAYHDHNKDHSAPGIVKMLLDGQDVALITDSGTPGISDPAFVLVRLALLDDIEIITIPGACAAIAALTISGLPMDRFAFEGFLPVRSGKRRTRLLNVKDDPRTQVYYESPHRIIKALAAMREVFGNRNAAVARELTKIHEEVIRGTLDDILERFGESKPRGEFVIIVEGNTAK